LLESVPGVVVKDIQAHLNDVKQPEGSKMYSMKGASILSTEYDEILFLDADNIPVRDPTFLFDHPSFRETGAVFWKDFWKTRPDNPIFKILELKCMDEFEQESGQILIKKRYPGVYKALSLAYFLQRNPDLYFRLILGDKDTFRLAWRALDMAYHMVERD
jgi:alpha-N-acetylglucosamine transferase